MVLTELESATLGVIRQLQPCSTYEVRQAFARAATRAWSSSAGTIYPVIEKLVKLGLARSQARPGDPRGRRDLAVTLRGEREIVRWVLALSTQHAASQPDPIRTRLHFLELLDSRDMRVRFLTAAEGFTRAEIARTRAFLKTEHTNAEIDYLASLGGLYQLEARLKWLGLVRRRLAA